MKFFPLIFALFFSTLLFSQETSIPNLFKQVTKYEIFQENSSFIKSSLESQRGDIKTLNLYNFEMTLFNSNIISENYVLKVQESDGIKEIKNPLPLTLNGYTRQGGRVSLTINDNFIYGFIEDADETYVIEPSYHYSNLLGRDNYVIYKKSDLKNEDKWTCGTDESMHVHRESNSNDNRSRLPGQCFEVQLAIASDWLMRQKYGSVTATENHAIGVLNDVQTNYDNEFADEIQFEIVTQFVSNCSTCDPWTSSTEASVLLESFRNWANSGGFGVGHDMGSIWTDRDFNGNTIGIAYLGAVCTSFGYNALQDFSSNANLKRVMVAHEYGHNFDAEHDPSGAPHIMAPAVQNTSTWSAASKTAIQNYYGSINCLSSCSSSSTPTAAINYNAISSCVPGQIQFQDVSTGTVTSRLWTFQGGTPATSTAANPLVIYNNAGTFDVTLTVFNGTFSNTLTLNDEIVIKEFPVASFTFVVAGNQVTFTNTSTYNPPATFLWLFGDGNSSTLENPVHVYANDGTYNVKLKITDICGTTEVVNTVVIATPPIANFSSNITSGCPTLTVNFNNTSSSNTTSVYWLFPGGTPSTSIAQNPVVSYNTPGSYNVTIEATNANGTTVHTLNNYITVHNPPTSNFTFSTTGTTVTFTNTSTFATAFLWNFGDGNTSTSPNPTHTYATPGNYTVSLTASNSQCNPATITQTVNTTAIPNASFTATANSGCAPLNTTFTSTSSNNPTSFIWTFTGGNPATSTLPNPSVSYDQPGTYDVTLIVSNAFGADTLTLTNYVQVTTTESSNFNFNNNALTYNFIHLGPGNATSYTWNFGDGNTSTLQNPTHTYASEGTYTVTHTTTNNCGTTTQTSTINALLPPTANFNSSNENICFNEYITYTDQSTGTITTRRWEFEGGSPSTANSPSVNVSYAQSGNYKVKLVVQNSAGADSIEIIKAITVTHLPNPNFNVDINGLTITANCPFPANAYLWTLPNGSTQSGNPIVFDVPSNGSYNLNLTSTNQCGTSTSTQIIAINALPIASFNSNINPNTLLCTPLNVNYTATANSNATYLWIFDGGTPATSNDPNVNVLYNIPGSYSVKLKVTNAFGEDSIIQPNYINVKSKPTANYTEVINHGTINCSYTGSAGNVVWEFANLGTATGNNASFTFTSNGTYDIKCISTNECGSDTLTKTFSIIVVNVNDENEIDAKIFPNPVDHTLYVTTEKSTIIEYEVIDILGKIQLKGKLMNTGVDVSNLVTGQYFINLKTENKSKLFRFTKN